MSRPVRAPEVLELRAFCAAADLGSLGKAARLLNVSQPALSKRLKALEAMVGTSLLNRGSKGVTLTPPGRQLYAEARKFLAQAEVVEQLMAALHGQEPAVRLALSPTIYEQLLPQLLADYEELAHLRLEISAVNSITAQRMVLDGRADMAIAALDPDEGAAGLEAAPLCEDEVVVGVSSRHNWSGYEEIPQKQFLSTPMLMRDPEANTRRVVEHELAQRGLSLAPPLLELGSSQALKAAARKQNAPAILSRMSIAGERGGLEPRRVEGLPFRRQFAVLVAGRESLTRPARALFDHVLDRPPAGRA